MSDLTTNRPALPESWFYPAPAIAASRLAELRTEVPPGHLLFRKDVEVFAACHANDDVLFTHKNEPDRFTVVHLTWIRKQEINPSHPSVVFDGTLAEFISREKQISEAA